MAERHGSFRRAACPCAWLGKGAVAPLAAGCNPVHSPKPVLGFQIYLMLGFACLVKGAPKGQHTVHTQHMGMKQGKQSRNRIFAAVVDTNKDSSVFTSGGKRCI